MSSYVRLAVPSDIIGIQGLKMTPQTKPGSAAGRMQHGRASSSRSHRKKPTSASDKTGVRVSNRLKRKYSKSASSGLKRSSGRSTRGVITDKAADISSVSQTFDAVELETRPSQKPSSGDTAEVFASVSGVHLKQKHLTEFPASLSELTAKDSGDNVKPDESLKQKDTDSATMSSSRSVKAFEDFNKEGVNGEASKEELEEAKTTAQEKERHGSSISVRELLRKYQGPLDEANCSDDDDDISVPNLLGYDFHAIYKKDGLQFDENWQNRMLEKYMLMKLQKKQRHEAANSKRVYLEQERRFRFISAQPDLIDKSEEPSHQDHDAMARYLLNSPLMSGSLSHQTVQRNGTSATQPSQSQSSKRPLSSSSNMQKSLIDEYSEKESNFRFSMRSKSPEHDDDFVSHPLKRSQHSMLSTATQASTGTTLKAKSSFLIERPRSSSSIPGKTRYILIKPEKEKKVGHLSSPSKLEEQLLQKRFPSQHSTVMKSLGRVSASNLPEIHEDDVRIWPPVDETAPERPPSANNLLMSGYRSVSDTGTHFCNRYASSASKPSEQFLNVSHSWKSSFSNSYINPLDIVKRKSPQDKRTTIEINLKSIHA